MLEGRIVKALSGYYYVKSEGELWQCRARGLFKKKKLSPLVGDWVCFVPTENGEGLIQEIAPRTTQLARPPLANADQAVIVSSLCQPDFQPLLTDKFLVHVERANMRPLVVLTKVDLCPLSHEAAEMIDVYRAIGYVVIQTSAIQQQGIEALRESLGNHISILAGQSGAGKTSLLNALCPDLELVTGEVSEKLGRGRHTTRHVEMIELPSGGLVADTPGFSQLSFSGWTTEELGACFPEMAIVADQCKFRGCLHDQEPHCAVKAAVQSQDISAMRYEHYVKFLKEIQDERRY